MSSERIKNSIFSEKTFELMSKFSEHILNYDNIEKIEELPEYNFFRE